jgi:hypothetical protein
MTAAWYRVALADAEGVRLAVAPGAHLGEAIATAVARVGRGRELWPVAAALAAAGEVPLGDSVGKGVVVERGTAAGVQGFRYPAGVIAALDEEGRAQGAAAGIALHEHGATAVLQAVVAGARAREAFLDIVERLPAVDNVEIVLADHHDPGVDHDEVWLTPRLRDVRKALRFLDDLDVDLLDSGHVDVAVYVREPRSTWRLTQHKTLVLLTDDHALRPRVVEWLAGLALPPVERLASVATIPHLHYRPAGSSDRPRLRNRLKKAGLRPVATVRGGVSTPVSGRA